MVKAYPAPSWILFYNLNYFRDLKQGRSWNTSTPFLILAQSVRLFLRTWALPPTPTVGVARIISLTPMPQPGIKLTLAL